MVTRDGLRDHGATFTDALAARIADFLVGVGLEISPAQLPEETFLPGILTRGGRLLVDPERMRYPGDLLHEAGHLAVLEPARRRLFGDPEGAAGLDMRQVELQAIGWSYAAAIHLAIDPAIVFHEAGYRGRSSSLLLNFGLGVFFGVEGLAGAGLTLTTAQAARLGAEPYPHMLKWLRE